MTDTSQITYDRNGNAVSFHGSDAVALFHAATLYTGLGLMQVGIKPHRSWTSLRAAFDQVTHYTDKAYSGKKDIDRARNDLAVWIAAMKAALPSQTLG